MNLGQEKMIVAVDNEECLAMIEGQSVMTENHCLDPLAMVTMSELGALDPTYEPAVEWGGEDFLRNLGRRSLVIVGENFDLKCFVPKEVLRHSLIAAEPIPLSDILIFDDAEVVDMIRNMFPANGVELRFNGFERRYDRHILDRIPG